MLFSHGQRIDCCRPPIHLHHMIDHVQDSRVTPLTLLAYLLHEDVLAVPVGELRGRGFTEQEFDACVRSLQEVAAVAAAEGVILALEPLNRFETFMLNTVQDGVRLMDAVAQPSVGLLLDTFHMHIEEKSTPDAIRRAGTHIKHFHCSENDRGTVGTGQVAWAETLQALADVHYNGWLVVESFNAVLPQLAGATCIWRPLAESPDALAAESLAFLKRDAY